MKRKKEWANRILYKKNIAEGVFLYFHTKFQEESPDILLNK